MVGEVKPTLLAPLIGHPLVFFVDRTQNCAKFKLDIWKQISHVLLANRNIAPEFENLMKVIADSVFNVGLSLEFCRLLTVRVVNSAGAGLLTEHWKRMYTGTAAINRPTTTNGKLNPQIVEYLSTKRTATGIPVKDSEWGSSVPDDKSISIGK